MDSDSPSHERRGFLLLAVAIVVTSAACRGGPASSSSSSKIGQDATKSAIVALAISDPLLYSAEMKLTAACMRQAGFRYPSGGSAVQRSGSVFGMVGMLTIRRARVHGYGYAIHAASGEPREDPVNRYVSSLSAVDRRRFYFALIGARSTFAGVKGLDGRVVMTPTRGCVATARNGVYGTPQNFILIARFPAYLLGYGDKIYVDPQFKRAQILYTECMSDAGYQVGGTGEALELARARFGSTASASWKRETAIQSFPFTKSLSRSTSAAASQAERAMATTDALCQQSSGIFAAWDRAGFDAASSWIDRHETEILRLRDLQEQSLACAKGIMTGRAGCAW